MDSIEAIVSEISGLTPTGILLMALVGLIVGVAPGSYPLLAAATGLSAGSQSDGRPSRRGRAVVLATGFVLGVALVDAALGALFGLFGFAVMRTLAQYMTYAYILITLVLLFLGLALLRVIRVNLRFLYASPRAVNGFWAAVLLGIPFGLSTCPACTPLILPVMIAAATSGDVAMGAVLLFVFGIARGIPIIIVAAGTTVLTRMRAVMLWVPRVERIGGVLLLVAAAVFGYQAGVYAGWFPPL